MTFHFKPAAGIAGLALGSMASLASAETISIAIGHQSMCTDTYTAGIVVKELGLLEKYLPTDGKYADALRARVPSLRQKSGFAARRRAGEKLGNDRRHCAVGGCGWGARARRLR
ncbi:MAG: hypothetical protein AAF281_08990, partial [Pseudomonadota bacterium]